MPPATRDVIVLGAGPSAWAIAGALTDRGVDVALVAPDPEARWTNTYGVWTDELAQAALAETDVVGARYESVTVTGERRHDLGRSYALMENAALAAALRRPAVHTIAGRVTRVEVGRGPRLVRTADGTTLKAIAVVDATGAGSSFTARSRTRRPVSVQAAYGIEARFDRPPVGEGACVLMDWRPPPGADPRHATFLYALDLGGGWFLAEETSLAAAPAMGQGELRRRLAARLASGHHQVLEVRREERVAIPMGLAVPRAQPVMAFGAAAGLIHPATGYSVGASLSAAGPLADALATHLTSSPDPEAVAEAGWSALWPGEARRVRALQEYGLEVLTGMPARETMVFFDAFFDLPLDRWSRYLDRQATVREMHTVMRAMFRGLPWSVRRRLFSGDPRRLIGAV